MMKAPRSDSSATVPATPAAAGGPVALQLKGILAGKDFATQERMLTPIQMRSRKNPPASSTDATPVTTDDAGARDSATPGPAAQVPTASSAEPGAEASEGATPPTGHLPTFEEVGPYHPFSVDSADFANLRPSWQPEEGGIALFYDGQGVLRHAPTDRDPDGLPVSAERAAPAALRYTVVVQGNPLDLTADEAVELGQGILGAAAEMARHNVIWADSLQAGYDALLEIGDEQWSVDLVFEALGVRPPPAALVTDARLTASAALSACQAPIPSVHLFHERLAAAQDAIRASDEALNEAKRQLQAYVDAIDSVGTIVVEVIRWTRLIAFAALGAACIPAVTVVGGGGVVAGAANLTGTLAVRQVVGSLMSEITTTLAGTPGANLDPALIYEVKDRVWDLVGRDASRRGR